MMGRPYRAWDVLGSCNPGRCPGLGWVAPVALGTVDWAGKDRREECPRSGFCRDGLGRGGFGAAGWAVWFLRPFRAP